MKGVVSHARGIRSRRGCQAIVRAIIWLCHGCRIGGGDILAAPAPGSRRASLVGARPLCGLSPPGALLAGTAQAAQHRVDQARAAALSRRQSDRAWAVVLRHGDAAGLAHARAWKGPAEAAPRPAGGELLDSPRAARS